VPTKAPKARSGGTLFQLSAVNRLEKVPPLRLASLGFGRDDGCTSGSALAGSLGAFGTRAAAVAGALEAAAQRFHQIDDVIAFLLGLLGLDRLALLLPLDQLA